MAEQPQVTESVERRASGSALRRLALQIVRLLVAAIATAVCGLALVSVLVLLQARRDETRHVDAAIVLSRSVDGTVATKYALDLYRRGYTERLIVAGAGEERMRVMLAERGLPATALIGIGEAASDLALWQRAREEARLNGVTTVLLVDEGANMLRDLKIARDLGLASFGAPLPGPTPDFSTVMRASLAYWAYVLLGQ